MQRVLSYQTAMRINGERDVRAYISKSTCISLVFSVAFVTLVLGKYNIIIYFSHLIISFNFIYI